VNDQEFEVECVACGGLGEYLRSPGGSWWAHEYHPTDNHDFVASPWDDPRACFGHCDPEGWFIPCRNPECESALQPT